MRDVTSEPNKPYSWQQASWNRLVAMLNENRLPHAVLLQGVADSGVDRFADLLGRALLCDKLNGGFPCGTCRSCHLVEAGTHPNIRQLSPELMDSGKLSKVIKIDQIRQVLDNIQQTSLMDGRKVIVLSPAEAMNPNAANALLKSLEEPPENTFFLLACYNPSRLLATIRSRCQQIDVPLPDSATAEAFIEKFIDSPSTGKKLLALSGNNPVLVSRWKEGGLDREVLLLPDELICLHQGKDSPLVLAASWSKSGAIQKLSWWWRWLGVETKKLSSHEHKHILPFMDKLLQAKRQLESSANPNEQLLLESLLIDWQNLPPMNFSR